MDNPKKETSKSFIKTIGEIFLAVGKTVINFFKYILYAILLPFSLVKKIFVKDNSKKGNHGQNKIEVETINNNINTFNPDLPSMDSNHNDITEDDILFKNKLDLNTDKTVGDRINDILENILKPFAIIIKKYKEADKKALAKQQERALKKFTNGPIIINFDTEESVQLNKKVVWRYKAVNRDGKMITGYFEAFSRVDVYSFLISENMTVYEITTNWWIRLTHTGYRIRKPMRNKDLIFFLTQLSTYIKAGIPLVEAMSILTRQFKKKYYHILFRSIMYDLTMGDSFSTALEKQGKAFPGILITMVKAAELTGELPETLDDMADYFTQIEESRREMISALTYPTIVFIFAIAVVTFVMIFVVPKFVEIYATMDESQIPAFTLMVINVSHYLEHNIFIILLFVLLILLAIRYVYRNVRILRKGMQWVLMHIPVIREIMTYKEVNMFAKTFHSLLSHNVYITDSVKILNHVTDNEIYKVMMNDTLRNLARGESISLAFKNNWAFPIPAYEMIVTGEKTGQLAEMMDMVADYYQDLYKNSVTRVKSLVEPMIIIFLTVGVGIIVLAIIVPMFNLYSTVQNLA